MFTLLITFAMFGAFFDIVFGKHSMKKVRFGKKMGVISVFRVFCTFSQDVIILAFKGGKGLFVFLEKVYKKVKKNRKSNTKPIFTNVISFSDYKSKRKNKVG